MGEQRENLVLTLLAVVLLVAVIGLFMNSNDFSSVSQLTGKAVETVYSEVDIGNYYAISLGSTLSTTGIDFGTISSLPVTNQNATGNYDGSDNTLYNISVSQDSNVNVDFCIKADNFNTSGGDEIGLGNYTFSNSSVSNATLPALGDAIAITAAYQDVGQAVTPGNSDHYRFWLSVPAAQNPGKYNNTVYFQGVQTGTACS